MIDPATQASIVEEKTTALAIRKLASEFVVATDEQYAIGAQYLAQIQRMIKQAEEKRKTITKPLLDAKRAIDDLFGEGTAALTSAKSTISEQMAAHNRRKAEAQAEAERKLAAGAEAQRKAKEAAEAALARMQNTIADAQAFDVAVAPFVPPLSVAEQRALVAQLAEPPRLVAGVRTTTSIAFRTVDAAKIPAWCRALDESAAREAWKAAGKPDEFEIDGVEVTITHGVAPTGR